MLRKDLYHFLSHFLLKGKKNTGKDILKTKTIQSFYIMNVHDELRRSLISKLTQVNERKLQKPLFPKVFIPSSSPQQELCEGGCCVCGFFVSLFLFFLSFSIHFWFLRISHSIQQFFEVSPEEGLWSPAQSIKHLHSWTELTSLSSHCFHGEGTLFTNISTSEPFPPQWELLAKDCWPTLSWRC